MKRFGSLTFVHVKAALADRGMIITKDTVGSGPTGSGEYRVTFSGKKWNMSKEDAESKAYYTNDLDDAQRTGIAMAVAEQNPDGPVFSERRKIRLECGKEVFAFPYDTIWCPDHKKMERMV